MFDFCLETPLQVAVAVPHMLKYQPEAGRLIVITTANDGTIAFIASMTGPNDEEALKSLITPVLENEINSAVMVYYVDNHEDHLDAVPLYFLLQSAGVHVADFITVARGAVKSILCGRKCCQGEGSRLPTIDSPQVMEAAFRMGGFPARHSNEMLPRAPKDRISSCELEATFHRVSRLTVEEQIELAQTSSRAGITSNITLATLCASRPVRDWLVKRAALRGCQDMAGTYLQLAMQCPQPWASNVAAVAVACYMGCGEVGEPLMEALSIVGFGGSSSFAEMTSEYIKAGRSPKEWVGAVLAIPESEILTGGGAHLA